VGPDDLVTAAAAVLRARHIDQLPVVDADGRTVGLLDVQDLLDARFL
jgi:arabinose-5-phosphate isomerase